MPHPLLWQIGSTLNTFIGRLYRLEYDSYTLQRESQQVQRVAEAIQLMLRGRQPIWPVPSDLPVDAVIVALTQLENATARAQGTPFASVVPAPSEPAPGSDNLPDWLMGPSQRPWEPNQSAPLRMDFWPEEGGSKPP